MFTNKAEKENHYYMFCMRQGLNRDQQKNVNCTCLQLSNFAEVRKTSNTNYHFRTKKKMGLNLTLQWLVRLTGEQPKHEEQCCPW